MSVQVHLVVALMSEARPLISHFGLSPRSDGGPSRLYRAHGVSLIVSRIGETASASAAGFLFAASGEHRDRPWINFGVAGHRDFDVGEGVLAHKVVDQGSGRVWYPQLVFDRPPGTKGATVTTVDRAETRYPGSDVYEMEAAGFVSAVSRFSPAELLQVYKVISDNAATGPDRLSAERVSELTRAHVGPIEYLIDQTRALASELEQSRAVLDLVPWLEHWHFTTTQRRHLRRVLSRLTVVDTAQPVRTLLDCPDASTVLTQLEGRLESRALDY